MNKDILNIFLGLIALLAIQIFIMDQIFFFGYINPMVYVLFLVMYPLENNRWGFMITAFLVGVIMDTFHDTGGAHAAACLSIAFARSSLLKLVFGESYLSKNIKLLRVDLDRLLIYTGIIILVHHFIYYSLVIFNMSQILELLQLTLSIALASAVVNAIILFFLRPRRR
jgi:rod shape-determining protein MreD